MSTAKPAVVTGVEVNEKLGTEGQKVCTLKVSTEVTLEARAISLLVGRDVLIGDAIGNAKARYSGTVKSVALKPHKERTGVVATGKIVGGPDLEKLIGKSLWLERAQEDLPGAAAGDEK